MQNTYQYWPKCSIYQTLQLLQKTRASSRSEYVVETFMTDPQVTLVSKHFFFKSSVEVLKFHIAEPLTHKMQQ